jgi:hypothetical protein
MLTDKNVRGEHGQAMRQTTCHRFRDYVELAAQNAGDRACSRTCTGAGAHHTIDSDTGLVSESANDHAPHANPHGHDPAEEAY